MMFLTSTSPSYRLYSRIPRRNHPLRLMLTSIGFVSPIFASRYLNQVSGHTHSVSPLDLRLRISSKKFPFLDRFSEHRFPSSACLSSCITITSILAPLTHHSISLRQVARV